MNRENIKKVRDHIARLHPEQFNMSMPFPPSLNDPRGCGCIKAWGQALLGDDEWMHSTEFDDPGTYRALIMPPGWEYGAYTRDQAVAVLDHLLETGEVDWSVAEGVAP